MPSAVETKVVAQQKVVTADPPVGSSQPVGGSGGTEENIGPPPPPKDIMEALQQRLAKYQAGVDQAKKEENSSKARRMGRIVKVVTIHLILFTFPLLTYYFSNYFGLCFC